MKNRKIVLVCNKCCSLSNIYYEHMIKIFPFNFVQKIIDKIKDYRIEKYYNNIENKYGDINKENDNFKFIWGIVSSDSLSNDCCGLMTMNDMDIVYDKKECLYMLGIETGYMFDNYKDKCKYLKSLLKVFTKYMDENSLDKNKPFDLFFSQPKTELKGKSVEELYTNFKIFVEGFCRLED